MNSGEQTQSASKTMLRQADRPLAGAAPNSCSCKAAASSGAGSVNAAALLLGPFMLHLACAGRSRQTRDRL